MRPLIQLELFLFIHSLTIKGVERLSARHINQERLMTDHRVRPGEKHEDQFTALLEAQTSTLPTSLFLGAAIASIIGSLSLKLAGKDHQALFVGQWAAPFLLLGIYNKMVKQHGSDSGPAHPHE